MKRPTLLLWSVASLFIAAGIPGFVHTIFGGRFNLDPTSVFVVIGIGLILYQRVARWAAIVCLCGAYVVGFTFLIAVLTSSTPRTITWEAFALPPATGYLLVVGALSMMLALAGAAHATLLRKEIREQFAKGANNKR